MSGDFPQMGIQDQEDSSEFASGVPKFSFA